MWLNDAIDKLCRVLIGVSMLVVVGMVFGQVFMRYVMGSFIPWAEELSRYAFVWLVFLGSATAFYVRSHLSINILSEMISDRARTVLDLVLCLLVLIFIAFFVYYSYHLTLRTMTQTSPSLRIPMGYVYMSMPIAGVLIAFHGVGDAVIHIKRLLTWEQPAPPGDERRGRAVTE
jgi:TRAP-type transport system small permease protein